MTGEFHTASILDICSINKLQSYREFCRLHQTRCDAVCESHHIPVNFFGEAHFAENTFRKIVERTILTDGVKMEWYSFHVYLYSI